MLFRNILSRSFHFTDSEPHASAGVSECERRNPKPISLYDSKEREQRHGGVTGIRTEAGREDQAWILPKKFRAYLFNCCCLGVKGLGV